MFNQYLNIVTLIFLSNNNFSFNHQTLHSRIVACQLIDFLSTYVIIYLNYIFITHVNQTIAKKNLRESYNFSSLRYEHLLIMFRFDLFDLGIVYDERLTDIVKVIIKDTIDKERKKERKIDSQWLLLQIRLFLLHLHLCQSHRHCIVNNCGASICTCICI